MLLSAKHTRQGPGVFALREFAAGDFILRRRHGRIVSTAGIPSLPEEERRHLCKADWETSAALLPPGCYLNHSCDPNAMRSGVKVLAWRSICNGDEVTIHYRPNAFDATARWECRCGGAGCTGTVVGRFFALMSDQQRLYLPYVPSFIRTEYRRRQVRAL